MLIFLGFCFLVLTLLAAFYGGYTFAFLGMGGVLAFSFLTLLSLSPQKAKVYLPAFLFSLSPFYLLFPSKGEYVVGAPLKYHSLFDSDPQWFAGLPEGDLIRMGENWGYTAQEKSSLRDIGSLASRYDEIEDSSIFEYKSSAVLDSWFFDRGHYWYFEPNLKRAPLLIFLHGSGGNFKSYQDWFLPFAQKHNIAMAFPTLGIGLWTPEKLAGRINDVILDIKSKSDTEVGKIYVCGLSQGSFTGMKAVSNGLFESDGFISISGVSSYSEKEIDLLFKIPLLVIHGDKDERSLVSKARKLVDILEGSKSDVTYEEYSGQFHTLIKVETEAVLTRVFEWIKRKDNK
ncbi:MAG: prolyl oligopeptidase family serine peptidase [Lentisphaeraceae bacterium]|nr:prolyl oligopeptidase family serine peptidase [Lentisphaeraceae bacterium]